MRQPDQIVTTVEKVDPSRLGTAESTRRTIRPIGNDRIVIAYSTTVSASGPACNTTTTKPRINRQKTTQQLRASRNSVSPLLAPMIAAMSTRTAAGNNAKLMPPMSSPWVALHTTIAMKRTTAATTTSSTGCAFPEARLIYVTSGRQFGSARADMRPIAGNSLTIAERCHYFCSCLSQCQNRAVVEGRRELLQRTVRRMDCRAQLSDNYPA